MNRLQDPLDGMWDIYVDKQLQPLADPYFCYLQCTCNEGWIWKRKMRNVSEMWQVNCYMCGKPWKESFLDRLGPVRLLVLGFEKKAEAVPSPVKLRQKGCWPYKRAKQSCKRAEIGPCKRAEKGLLFLQHCLSNLGK